MFEIPEDVKKILRILENNKKEAYLVGGCVRDLLLGLRPKDWDLTSNARPEEIREIFAPFAKVIPTGIKHGTMTIVYQHIHYEITSYRKDGLYLDSRHPETVEFTSNLEEDLKRRDFTINAMALDLRGDLVDLFQGQADLERGLIRSVFNPQKRFSEDALRMLRAIRFSSQLNFNIEARTLAAIKYKASSLKKISQERIRDELIKILLTEKPSKAFYLLYATDLLDAFLPELAKAYGFQQKNPHHYLDIFEHSLKVVDEVRPDKVLRLAALLHDIGKVESFSLDEEGIGHFYRHNIIGEEMSKKILSDLRFPKKDIENVSILVREHMNVFIKDWNDKILKKFIARVKKENVFKILELNRADMLASSPKSLNLERLASLKKDLEEVLSRKEALTISDLAISGQDLIALGLKPGPVFSKILEELLELVLEKPNYNKKEILIKIVQEKYL